MAQSVSLLVSAGAPKVASSSEMAAWRKAQADGYGDIEFVIKPIEGLGVPAILNQIEGAGLATIESAAKGMLVDVSSPSPEESKELAAKVLARLP